MLEHYLVVHMVHRIELNTIDFVIIATTGNAKDFGDLTSSIRLLEATSDSHGGLAE